MAKSKRSKRSRKSSSDSSSCLSSGSDSTSFSDSSSSDFLDTKNVLSGRLAKWIVKGIPEKHVKVAREAFKPSVEKLDKKYDASNLFTNARLNEMLYASLKSGPNEWRPIINLKPLIRFLKYRNFKMDCIVTVRHTLRQGDFMAKVDLTGAYFIIQVF
ncbi:hypothetical protein OUZ56_005462 [Daphnia magna]|uniref:Uncharacterized protein n=1 Tax=Daphnia magna TaxID=35525 RepID=A0ABQ9YSU8_9CRUS|nr:hypothetical protein OUZ56_005462 [Daphnia magna]